MKQTVFLILLPLTILSGCFGSRSKSDNCRSASLAESLKLESATLDTIVEQEEYFILNKTEEYQTNGDSGNLKIALQLNELLKPIREEYFGIHYMTGRLIFRQTRSGKLTPKDLELLFATSGRFKPNPKDSAELYSDLKDTTCTKNHLLTHLIGCSNRYLDTLKKYNGMFQQKIQK